MRISFAFRFVVCGLLAASAVGAQQPQSPTDPSAVLTMQRNQTAQLAATWLRSGDPRLQAWGAYVVLRDQHKQFNSELLAIVNAHEVSGWPLTGFTETFRTLTSAEQDRHDAMLAVLDAVIQLHAEVPASDAARLYPEFPAQSLILLSRDGREANSYLLEIFRAEHLQQAAWLAAGNLLVGRLPGQRVPGFAIAVLENLTVHARITVTTSGTAGRAEGWGGDCANSGPEDKAEWPEIGTYALLNCLSERNTDGATLLAGGTYPAYYKRTVSALYNRVPRSCCGFSGVDVLSPDLIREDYLAGMLNVKAENSPLKSNFNQTVIWKDQDAYFASLRDVVNVQRKKFAEMARKLTESRLMTDEEALGLKPKVEITVVDARDDVSTPLPRTGNLGENVTVKM